MASAEPQDLDLGIVLPRRDARSTELARQLMDHILSSGRYSVGDRLPSERQLAAALGVGRSAVREALTSLSLLGLVEIRQGSGSYLRTADSDILPRVLDWGLLLGNNRLEDLYETDLYLEPAVARLAARRRTASDLEELRTVLEKVDAGGPSDKMVRDIVEFHLQLATASRNNVMIRLVSSLQVLLEAWSARVVETGAGCYPGQPEHRAIYEAIERGDADAAESAMIEHITRGADRLSDILGADWRLAY
jgi:GntR family transcriptional repressor for pyruvate dehydrogenase complex